MAMATDEKTRTVRIELTGLSTGTVEVDGHDVSHLVYALSLNAEVGEMPNITLELQPDRLEIEAEDSALVADFVKRAYEELQEIHDETDR